MNSVRYKIIGSIAIGVCIFTYVMMSLPVISVDFIDMYISALLMSSLMIVIFGFYNSKLRKRCFLINIAIVIYLLIIPFLGTNKLIHSNSYRNLIGNVKESKFEKDVSPVSINDIRLVDKNMAMKLGDKKLGEIPAIGSVSMLGEFHIQKVKDKLYWVAPLVHRNMVKWATNMEGTTGYVMVSACDPQDVKLVQEVNGEPIRIVYQPEAYLLQNLKRHVYLNKCKDVGMEDFTMEIDDKGTPYWIVTLYEHTIGFSGKNAVGVAVVDAKTGDVSRYGIDNTPKWIDRIQPAEFVEDQINDWGKYVHGFWNAIISEKDVLTSTRGISLVYGNDGKSYWYTGITSSGADDSTVGFVLIDTRTKEAKFYKQPGATEYAGMISAAGKVQEKGYEPTFPIMYNILGKPTYVTSLKDKAGLVKMVAFVSVEDYNVVGIGNNKEEAFRSYREVLRGNDDKLDVYSGSSKVMVEGVVDRFNEVVTNGNTSYYFTLKGESKSIFIASSKLSSEIPITNVGDNVKVAFEKNQKNKIDVMEFENLKIN